MVLGFGLGLTVAALLMMLWSPGRLTKYQVEQKARELGMVYRHEVLSIGGEGQTR